jgi:hypothetical protein
MEVSGQLHCLATLPQDTGRYGGLTTGLDDVTKRESLHPSGIESPLPGHPDGSLVTILTELQRLRLLENVNTL